MELTQLEQLIIDQQWDEAVSTALTHGVGWVDSKLSFDFTEHHPINTDQFIRRYYAAVTDPLTRVQIARQLAGYYVMALESVEGGMAFGNRLSLDSLEALRQLQLQIARELIEIRGAPDAIVTDDLAEQLTEFSTALEGFSFGAQTES